MKNFFFVCVSHEKRHIKKFWGDETRARDKEREREREMKSPPPPFSFLLSLLFLFSLAFDGGKNAALCGRSAESSSSSSSSSFEMLVRDRDATEMDRY